MGFIEQRQSLLALFLMMKPCTITTAQLQVKKVSLRDGFDLAKMKKKIGQESEEKSGCGFQLRPVFSKKKLAKVRNDVVFFIKTVFLRGVGEDSLALIC